MSAALHLDAVRLVVAGRTLLDGLTRVVEPGTLVAVTGVAGSGKSVVLDLIAGTRAPDAGTLRRPDPVVTVSQAHDLLPTLTAVENVALAALAGGVAPTEAWERAVEWLERLALPGSAQANLAEELSGGQHQRVALARALAADARLVVADDPTSELDEVSVERAAEAIAHRVHGGAIVVVATTEQRLLEAADQVVELRARE